MTTMEQIQATLAEITEQQKRANLSNEAFKAQIAASQEAADRRAEAADRRAEAADHSLEAFKAQLAASQEAADRRAEAANHSLESFKAQLAASQEAADRRTAEADRRAAEAAEDTRILKHRLDELGKQLGGLGNKFGSFTEGLLLPSVETMLRKQFGVTDFYMRLKTRRGAELQELDGFGFVNGKKNIGFVIEVKSHLDRRSVEQTLDQMRRFGKFHPQYKGMTLYGIIAAVDTVSESQRKAVYNAGLYLVTVKDEVVTMPTPPRGFTPASEVV